MKHTLKNRIISGFVALLLILTTILPSGIVFGKNEEADVLAVQENTETVSETETEADKTDDPQIEDGEEEDPVDDQELEHQNIELYPDEADPEKTITLDGMMPKEAIAEVADVTEQSETDNVIAAYDITIVDGEEEYQPGEENPIHVEITDPRITDGANLQIWHVTDDGKSEEITDFTVENGKVTFDAVGFSVYKIVSASQGEQQSLMEMLESKGEEGFNISFNFGLESTNTNPTYYFVGVETEVIKNGKKHGGRTGLSVSRNAADSTKVYFEKSETATSFYMYTLDGEERHYITNHFNGKYGDNGANNNERSALKYAESKADATPFHFDISDDRIKINANSFYWVADDASNIRSVTGYKASADANNAWMSIELGNVPGIMDGKTYGLMHLTGGTSGYALMAGDKVHTLTQMVPHKTDGTAGETLYVDEGSEVTRWTFHSTGMENYILSGETEAGTKYLAVEGDALVLKDTSDDATEFQLTIDTKSSIRLLYGDKCVGFVPSDGSSQPGFAMVSKSDSNSWLSLLDFATLTDEDMISYSADRISVSEAVNGEKVIVYTRIWNETEKKYDIYAVDADGSLYPCYASGGKILWLANGADSLEWVFTEYYDSVTKEPNYYYELFNPYSEKYLAPQLKGNQVLSDNIIGINMQGRRDGEFYSEIIAWDKTRYAYVGLRPNAEKTALEPCAQSVSIPFYFATLEEFERNGKLNTVATVDNREHGITMKMQDFSQRSDMSTFLGNDTYTSQSAAKNLLSTNLGDDGYPMATKDGRSLKTLYSAPKEVNHLFIDSVYNSSGYFEFDSCQNFATLCNADGTPKTPEDGVTNFTVYKELGTTDGADKTTLKHGQFLPYNIIKENRYASKNGENLYSALAEPDNNKKGILSEEDPRKYEKLYLVSDKNNSDNPNYYNGMELEASFVQTVSGLDAWGHDMIFEFTGDDDFWLYVDGELVIDLGGVHSALKGTVNFRTGEVYVNGTNTTLKDVFVSNYKKRGLSDAEIDAKVKEIFDQNSAGQYIFQDYSSHTMRIFYMERGGGASNLHMRFNLASIVPGNVVVSKTVSGDGAEDMDLSFVEYPFQIYYWAEQEDGSIGEKQLLNNEDAHVHVTYQNSNKPVTYVHKYRPPGFTDEEAYNCVYFINPSKNAEISFPANTISYQIVECAVDSGVYGDVLINGQHVPDGSVETKHNLRSYYSEIGTSEEKPNISFDNLINDNVVKDLFVTKKLVDENGQEITDDPTTFSFRLYMSSVTVDEEDIPLANMQKYYVLSPNKKLCIFDYETAGFAETSYEYDKEMIRKIKSGEITDILPSDITFNTSGFGAISGIPAGYTVVVPGLPTGAVFKLTEDIQPGYGLLEYQVVKGEKINEYMQHEDIPSYYLYGDSGEANVGQVRVEENPQMEVVNQKGFGLTVKKIWSDLNLTTAHQTIYTAVYVDGELLDDSVRQIKSPDSSVYYFWPKLKPYANGNPRTTFDGYVVREVTLGNANPTVAKDGTVTNYGTITPVESGDTIRLSATRTDDATPDGEAADKEFDYVTTYSSFVNEDTVRTDTIRNTRKGGIAVRLFKWNSEEPLQGGTFTIKDSSGKIIGTYTSDSEGIVTMMYSFERNQIYTLTETEAPKGYIGLQKQVCFKINDDDTVSLFYAGGSTEWGTLDTADIPWVSGKPGSDGITAFVDVYNKPLSLKIVKTDSKDPDMMLEFAHFALFKQVKTSVGGYVKSKNPMSGFGDMVTENGVVYICGGNSGRVLSPGSSGSVYYLTETEAPLGYAELDKDIMFRISALGVPSLISDSYSGQLVEEDDGYTYTLSVPNVKNSSDKYLTIRKVVEGKFGNRSKDFTFTITVTGAGVGEELIWLKNKEAMTPIAAAGGSFTMGHGDVVQFLIPEGADVSVSEENEDYKTTFKLGKGEVQQGSWMSFTFVDDISLLVTNTKEGIVPTGVWMSFGKLLLLGGLCLIGIFCITSRKRRTEAFLQRMRDRRQ